MKQIWVLLVVALLAVVVGAQDEVAAEENNEVAVDSVGDVEAVEEAAEDAAVEEAAEPAATPEELKVLKAQAKVSALAASLGALPVNDPKRAVLETKLVKAEQKLKLAQLVLESQDEIPEVPEKPAKTATPEEKNEYKLAKDEAKLVVLEKLIATLEPPTEAEAADASGEVAEEATEEPAAATDGEAAVEPVAEQPRVLKSVEKVEKVRAKLESKKSKKKEKKSKKNKDGAAEEVAADEADVTDPKLAEALARAEFDRQYVAEHGEENTAFLFVDPLGDDADDIYTLTATKIAKLRHKLAYRKYLAELKDSAAEAEAEAEAEAAVEPEAAVEEGDAVDEEVV